MYHEDEWDTVFLVSHGPEDRLRRWVVVKHWYYNMKTGGGDKVLN
jgi:hypothetical protein